MQRPCIFSPIRASEALPPSRVKQPVPWQLREDAVQRNPAEAYLKYSTF